MAALKSAETSSADFDEHLLNSEVVQSKLEDFKKACSQCTVALSFHDMLNSTQHAMY